MKVMKMATTKKRTTQPMVLLLFLFDDEAQTVHPGHAKPVALEAAAGARMVRAPGRATKFDLAAAVRVERVEGDRGLADHLIDLRRVLLEHAPHQRAESDDQNRSRDRETEPLRG